MNNYSMFLMILASVWNLAACSSSRHVTNISGEYKEGKYGTILNLKGGEFWLTERSGTHTDKKRDTISLGHYVIENDLLVLSTPQLDTSFFTLLAEESEVLGDTIYFDVSDISKSLSQAPDNLPEFDFVVSVYSGSGRLILSTGRETGSLIKIPNPARHNFSKVSMIISVNTNFTASNIGLRYWNTNDYRIRGKSVNYFKLFIPGITYNTFVYKRMKRDFVKIIDKFTLEWDGETYKK